MPNDPTPTPAPAPAPTPAPAPAPAPAPEPSWHGFTDPETVAYVQNKGWQNPADAIRSYRGAEKLIGRDPDTIVPLPRADDPDGRRSFLSKLGVPESPDKYEFEAPEGMQPDPDYQKYIKETFHKLGLPAAEAKQLTKAHNEYLAQQIQKAEEDYKLGVESDKQALMAEWKGGYERMFNRAKTAANALGFTPEMVDAIERSVGYAGTYKFLAEIGGKLAEDSFVTSDDKSTRFGDTMTPAEAKGEWDKLKLDEAFTKALYDVSHPGHQSAAEKQKRLFGIMYPE
jgi:hypothetical protein